VIKNGEFNKEGQFKVLGKLFQEEWPRKFSSETFYNGYENLKQMPKRTFF
jgi:hypothetical protein